MNSRVNAGFAVTCLLFCVLGCSKFALPGKVDLFEGDNAAQTAAKIKAKVGSPTVNVIRLEMRTNEMEVTIQSPSNPKDIDKYTYKDGNVTGPEPVQVMSFGQTELTGDKYTTTSIDDIGFAAIPATVKRAIEVSKLDDAHVNLISMDGQSVETGNPELKENRKEKADALSKELEEKRKACSKDIRTMGDCWRALKPEEDKLHELQFGPGFGKQKLVLTWRLFVEGPRGRKDFWADKNGKLNEQGF